MRVGAARGRSTWYLATTALGRAKRRVAAPPQANKLRGFPDPQGRVSDSAVTPLRRPHWGKPRPHAVCSKPAEVFRRATGRERQVLSPPLEARRLHAGAALPALLSRARCSRRPAASRAKPAGPAKIRSSCRGRGLKTGLPFMRQPRATSRSPLAAFPDSPDEAGLAGRDPGPMPEAKPTPSGDPEATGVEVGLTGEADPVRPGAESRSRCSYRPQATRYRPRDAQSHPAVAVGVRWCKPRTDAVGGNGRTTQRNGPNGRNPPLVRRSGHHAAAFVRWTVPG